MIRQSLITEEKDFFSLEEEWRALLPRTRADNIFLTWEWISTWWEVFGEGKQPHILTFRDSAELVGILPCYIKSRSLLRLGKIRELRFLGTGETVRSEYLDFICLPEYREECLENLAAFLPIDRSWDIAILSDLLLDSTMGRFLTERCDRCEIIGREPCYYVEVPETFEKYLMSINKKKRGNIRTCRRKLERDFSVEYHRLSQGNSFAEWLEEFKHLHAMRLKVRGLLSKFSDPRYELFHSRFSRHLRAKGWLFAPALSLDNKSVAARYDFVYNDTVYDYQTGYNPEYSRWGVMQALISYIIEDCATRRIRKYDFLAGDDDYKRRFSNAEREVCAFRLFNQTGAGRLYELFTRIRKWISRK